MGTIVLRAVRRAEGGAGQGVLEVTAEWVDHEGKALLREDTRFVFRAADGMRGVDRITTLTALSQPVTFTDEKDGLLGLRVARSLEQPSTTAEVFTDAAGHATSVPVLQCGRDWPLLELRGSRGRLGVGHARSLDHAVRRRFRRARDGGHSGPSQERRLPHIL